ncbi:MAG: sulfatase [Thermoanaerobaculia bacterium]
MIGLQRLLQIAVIVTVCGLLPWPAPGETAKVRPNVILVVIDTVRADHLSAYGYARPTSPTLAQLGAEGTLYEHAVSAAPWTLPSHASLFTGLPVRDHGTDGNHWTLEARFDTLAEKLQRAGYRTAGFSNNVWTNDVSGLKQGFDQFEELWHGQTTRGANTPHDDPDLDMGAARTNERILAFVDGLDRKRPFFVFANYFEPHMPYRPTRPFDDDFLPQNASASAVTTLRSFFSPREYAYILGLPTARIAEPELAILTSLYDGEIAYVDATLGKLFGALRERRRLDDTIVVVTSDHGEHLGEHHLLEHKFSIYEPLLHVPLIVRAPGRAAAGARIATPVAMTDLFGTILAWTGVDRGSTRVLPLRDVPGVAPVPIFSELEFPGIFLEVMRRTFPGWDTRRFERSLTAVRRGSYKLIAGSNGSAELFDLASDPSEEHDLAAVRPKLTAELEGLLADFARAAPARTSPSPARAPGAAVPPTAPEP